MTEKIESPLWMISYTYGNDRWARSDEYEEFKVIYLTDLHPVEYIARCKEFWKDGGNFSDFRIDMEIPAGTLTRRQLDIWKGERKFTRGAHMSSELDKDADDR